MSTEVITQPPRSFRSPPIALVALASSGTSETTGATAPRATLSAARNANACPGDGGVLLASVAAMPPEVSSDIMTRLSASTRVLLSSAAEQSAITLTMPEAADLTTLAAVLSRVGPTDAAVVMSGFPPQTRDAIFATAGGSACP